MPDIFHFQSERWELVIWTRNSTAPREELAAVLQERSKVLPLERICFSFPLTGSESCTFEDNKLPVEAKRSEIEIPEPLCYENRDYEFEFRFKTGYNPDKDNPVINRISEVENSFRSVGSSSRGVINFGNNIGWFKLGIRYFGHGRTHRDTISFKVFPTKMDMEKDLDEIGKVIDSTYPLWRFSLDQKTDSILSRSKKRHESFELLWLAQFRSLAQELAGAVKLICRSPHSRLILNIKSVKAERITGKITGRLEERIKETLLEKQYDKRYSIEKRKLSYDTPENRFVKMVLLYSVRRLKLFSFRVRELEKNPENARLSESFYDELCELISPFEKLSSEPLFREIGSYDGRMCESLVLHQRAGYAKTYSIWQQLKLYLDYFGSDAFVSIRSVEQLYEIWCLLEVRRLLMELGFNEGKSPNRHLKTSGFEKKLKKADEMFHLHRPDGMKALLVHEPSYSGPKKSEFGKIYSWTTTQRPDIFLEITLPAGDKVRWVFDAKYRIDNNGNKKWPQTGIDTVPDDAINQMHRYRDSLIYISKAVEDGDRDKSRPIVGAFALYPGWFDQNSSENPYQDSVEAVGIGAFPLLPGQENRWLAEFLKSQIGEYSETSYEAKEVDELYLQESVRIAPYGMKQYRHSELVLAADIFDSKGRAYVRPFEEGAAQWYHIPESTVQNYKISRHVMREMKFCAFSTNSDDGRRCLYFYPVVSVVLKLRNEIDEYAGGSNSRGGESLYWLIELGKSFQAPVALAAKKKQRKFRFRLVAFHDFLKAESWDDIPRKYLKNV
ncbi:MAG: DUF2357 domain-containing protein [Desulfobacterium sp.]|jgi:predicted component of viral defense system (DUF524 family)|nr:DUF2357 domain-containing protein [Desulfobacterium sp.]